MFDSISIKKRVGSAGARGRYGVILAGGEGSRLKDLTRLIEGDERPKQFCHIIGGQSLLDSTRSRISRIIEPENIHYSLTAKHSGYFRPMLSDVPEKRLHIQPSNKGTAPAILFSLLRLSSESPDAVAGFFPSDHYFTDDAALMANVDKAFRSIETGAAEIVLLGMEADTAETSYGWIEPSESLFGSLSSSLSKVERFWEKPDRGTAMRLLKKGGLWNTFVMVGRVSSLLKQFETCLPELYGEFTKVTASGRCPETDPLYDLIPDSNFSSDVLERCPDKLHVLRVSDVGWNDLGEPQRVLGTLSTLGINAEWMAYAA